MSCVYNLVFIDYAGLLRLVDRISKRLSGNKDSVNIDQPTGHVRLLSLYGMIDIRSGKFQHWSFQRNGACRPCGRGQGVWMWFCIADRHPTLSRYFASFLLVLQPKTEVAPLLKKKETSPIVRYLIGPEKHVACHPGGSGTILSAVEGFH